MAHVLLVNPSHKKRRRRRKTAARRNPANPIHRVRARRKRGRRTFALRRYRRNPAALGGFKLNTLTSQLVPVGLGAAGAIATDMAIDKLPIPIDWKLGNKRHVAKAGVAVGLGFLAGAVAGKANGAKAMGGALTVVAYDWLKGMLARMNAPAVAPAAAPAAVAGMGFYPEVEYDNGDMGLVLENGVGAYDEYEEGVGEPVYY